MLAFGIRYLNGFAVATEPDVRDRAEWPPHPGRVFMALAAAHFQTGADSAEREALTWLEDLDEAPAIRAGDYVERSPVTQYVPVNDKPGPAKALLQSVPLTRDRQPRTFARAFLEHDMVYLIWPSAEPAEAMRHAFEGLCAKVTRIGHSSSLVQMCLANGNEVGEPDWVPDDERATEYLRVAGPGTLAELERLYNAEAVDAYADLLVAAADDSDRKAQRAAKKRLKEEFSSEEPPQLRPRISLYRGYAPATVVGATSTAPGTVFDVHPIVLGFQREDGPQRELDLSCVLAVVQRWREAIISQSNGLPGRIRGLLSGHKGDGAPLEEPHLAFLPLAFVGHSHADGRLLGMGLSLPSDISRDERRKALQAIAKVRHLALGRLGLWRIAPERRSSPPWNLRPRVWTSYPQGATHWSTVTPVVFDRHPKTKDRGAHQKEVAAMIASACKRIGLPQPRNVIVTHVSAHLGVPPAFAFPRLTRKDGSERRHAHAILVFDEPVCGPIMIGAGRYRGYGVARAVNIDEAGMA
ncbi:MAG: type I-G CRISPR-associated protein Csb2 [Acidimicrobiia bacterium]